MDWGWKRDLARVKYWEARRYRCELGGYRSDSRLQRCGGFASTCDQAVFATQWLGSSRRIQIDKSIGTLHEDMRLSAAKVEIFSLIGRPSIIVSENEMFTPVRN